MGARPSAMGSWAHFTGRVTVAWKYCGLPYAAPCGLTAYCFSGAIEIQDEARVRIFKIGEQQ
jgi:hypothetical protein